MTLTTLTERQLLTHWLADPSNRDIMADLVHTMFAPRFLRINDTAVTLSERDRGAILLLTNASTVTVTMPPPGASGLGAAYLTSIIPLGAGGATISGTHVGGSTVAQNGFANLFTLDDSSWFVTGAS